MGARIQPGHAAPQCDNFEAAALEGAVVAGIGDSPTVGAHWATPVGFLFIDGGHAEDVAMADYDMWAHRVLPGGVLGLIDFGMVGRIEERLREDIEEMLLAIVQRDVVLLTSLIKRVGTVPPNLDESAMRGDIADFVETYANQPLQQFDVSGALNEMMQIIRKYHVTLPAQVGLLIKTLVTLEGTVKSLSPDFSLLEVMQPFHRRLIMRRLSPARQIRKIRRIYVQLENLAEVLPGRIVEILDQVQRGKFDVHLDHRRLGPSVNRLVLGMLASALFLGSSILLSQRVPPLLFPGEPVLGMKDLSLLGLTGSSVAILVSLRLLRAIGKSGHLDRQD